MFLKKNFKKIFTAALILVLFFGVSYSVKSITLADIELFITLGIIPAENAERARDFLNLQKTITSGAGNIIQTDSGTSKECLIINQNLIKGKSGTLVSALQRFLKSQGHFPQGQEITGYFGDVTVQAVSDFQVRTGLIKTSNQIGAGTVGPITQKKIQEISCATEVPSTVVDIATTSIENLVASSTPVQSFYSNNTNALNNVTTVKVQESETFSSEDTGNVRVRYQVQVDPPEAAQYLEVVIICDLSAVDMQSKDVNECGKIFRIDPVIKGKRSINVSFKNKSRFAQPVIFAIEVFDEDRNTLGFVEKKREIMPAKPVIKIQTNDSTSSQVGNFSFKPENCSYDERLDFIRYTMTPFSPSNPVTLPICWPGEMLCNSGNPPSYCKITNGPSSDDLCSSSQKFVKGQCVAK